MSSCFVSLSSTTDYVFPLSRSGPVLTGGRRESSQALELTVRHKMNNWSRADGDKQCLEYIHVVQSTAVNVIIPRGLNGAQSESGSNGPAKNGNPSRILIALLVGIRPSRGRMELHPLSCRQLISKQFLSISLSLGHHVPCSRSYWSYRSHYHLEFPFFYASGGAGRSSWKRKHIR